VQHARLLSKNNFVQKVSKNDRRPVMFGTVSALIARKNTGAYYISAFIMPHSTLSGTAVLEARPKV